MSDAVSEVVRRGCEHRHCPYPTCYSECHTGIAIRAAILAERERCAGIINARAAEFRTRTGMYHSTGVADALSFAAAAIRSET